MTRLLLAAIIMFPVLAHAQVSPSRWSQNYIPTLTDWKAALLYNGQGFSEAMSAFSASTTSALAGKLAIGAESDSQLVTGTNSLATGTRARTLAERAMSMPQPQDFLSASQAVSDLITGSIDIGVIINAAETAGVRSIYLPCGTYKLATQITMVNNFTLQGAGACSVLSVQMLAGSGISGTAVQFLSLQDFAMQADVTRTGGAAISLTDTFETNIRNVFFTNGSGKHWSDIALSGANGTHMDHLTGRGGVYDGVYVTGGDKRSEDTYLTNSGFDGYGNASLEMNWASGFYATNLDILGGTVAGVLIDPGSSTEVDGVRMTNVLSDSNYGPGWSLTGSGAITEFNITNCWGSTNGIGGAVAQGILIDNVNINSLAVESSEFHANTGTGIDIQQGTRIVINGNTVFMNSTAGSGLYPGINVGANPNFLSVTGNLTGAGGEAMGAATVSLQNYGILSVSNSSSGHYAAFTGNMATGNTTGGFSIATGTNVTTSNNVGF